MFIALIDLNIIDCTFIEGCVKVTNDNSLKETYLLLLFVKVIVLIYRNVGKSTIRVNKVEHYNIETYKNYKIESELLDNGIIGKR